MKKPRALFFFCLITVAIAACLAGNSYGEEHPNLPTPDVSLPEPRPVVYECPRTKYINCMPPVQGEAKVFCSKKYLDWARRHCPDVNVVY
jgi:hypothetical protein